MILHVKWGPQGQMGHTVSRRYAAGCYACRGATRRRARGWSDSRSRHTWLTLSVGGELCGQNVHFRWSDLGAPLTLPGCTSSAAATHSCEASMLELTRIASSSAAGAARGRERGPELAQRRPSNDHVGVLAGAPPANGPSGCNPSAPSPWCSPCPSSSPRRRTRCSSHRMPASLIHHAA